MTSAEAATLGLITRSVAGDDLLLEAMEVAKSVAKGPVGAFAATRRLLLSSGANTPETQMDLEAQSVRAQAMGGEGREGVSAFLGKRVADFVLP